MLRLESDGSPSTGCSCGLGSLVGCLHGMSDSLKVPGINNNIIMSHLLLIVSGLGSGSVFVLKRSYLAAAF